MIHIPLLPPFVPDVTLKGSRVNVLWIQYNWLLKKMEARRLREGLECYLLWQYRFAFGASTRYNHGRFHPRYWKSTDRKQGVVGFRLPVDAPDNPAGGPSLPPLQLGGGEPCEQRWMELPWVLCSR